MESAVDVANGITKRMAATTEQADGRVEANARDTADPGRRLDPGRIALGFKSGAIATVTMTVFRMPISDSLPPTADFWARFVAGGEPEDHPVAGLVLHLAYGAFAGALLAAVTRGKTTDEEASREFRGVLVGLAYGFLLSAFGERVLLAGLLDVDLEPDERFIFHLSHAVYGLTLGAWLGSRER